MLEVAGGNKDKVGDTQRRCSPTETVDTGWVITREIGEPGDTWRREKSWAVRDPDPDSIQSGWKVGLCERLGILLGVSGLKRRILFLKKARWLFRELS